MGETYLAKCKKCGFEFSVSEGGGFRFHLLRCDKCGKTRSIDFDKIGEPHLGFIKGLDGPYCMATADSDRNIQKNYLGEPLTESEYRATVEKMVGKCRCGGKYRFAAPPRCPKCRSPRIEKKEEVLTYD
jgi:predicted Zn-ribbon and HTH transcriptional regulator